MKRILCVLVLTSLTLSACTDDGATPQSSGSGRKASVTPTPTRAHSGPQVVAEVDVAAGIGPLAVSERYLTFPHGGESTVWDKVAALNLKTGTLQTIARSSWTRGLINWTATTGDWIGWVDQSAQQSDANPRVLWRVWAKNVTTGATVLLASNRSIPDPFVPRLFGRNNAFYWTQAERDRSARETVWRTETQRRISLRHIAIAPASETLVRNRLIYLSNAVDGQSAGGDCWGLGLHRKVPRPLTRSAFVMACSASANRLAWFEHIDPKHDRVPEEGVLDDPYELWTKSKSSRKPKLLHRGYMSSRYPLVGDNFVAWSGAGGGLRLMSERTAKPVLIARTSSYTATDGHSLIAFAQDPSADRGTLLTVEKVPG